MLGPYRIEDTIAQGGMGTVYLAEHVRLGRVVALKVLNSDYNDQKELISRFLTEAQAVNQIDHENIVEVTDFVADTSSDVHYIVMERLHGVDLLEVVEREKALSLERCVAIGVQVTSALQAAHDAGIIHRDLKPDNIFLAERHGQRDFVKILDFGVAKLRDDRAAVAMSAHRTTPGTMLGTPRYMSPEQACGKTVDHRTDIYSFGVILYQMVTGRVPFEGDTIAQIIGQQLEQQPLPPSRYADLPHPIEPALELLILRCLAKDPDERPESMAAIRAELEALAPKASTTAAAQASTSGISLVLATGLVIAALLIGGVLGWSVHSLLIRSVPPTVELPAVAAPDASIAPQPESPGLQGWGEAPESSKRRR